MTNTTIENIKKHCFNILQNSKCSDLLYHNLTHTQEVIDNVYQISNTLGMQAKEIELLVIVACFHDTGFSETYDGHEEASKKLATEYLTTANFQLAEIKSVCAYIEATKMPQNPSDIYAQVLCDADLCHLGTTNFWPRCLLLRKEWEQSYGLVMTDKEWKLLNIKFLEEHSFKSPYGKKVLEKGKQDNLTKLKQLL